MNEHSKYLKLFSEVIPVGGFKRSVIYDLIRSDFTLTPKGLYDLISKFQNIHIDDIFNSYNLEDKVIVGEYLSFLKSKDYIFFCDKEELSYFKKLNLDWDYPAIISSSVVHLSSYDSKYLRKVVTNIESTCCVNVVFIFDFAIEDFDFDKFQSHFKNSRITNIELIFCKKLNLSIRYINSFKKFKRVNKVVLCQDLAEFKNHEFHFSLIQVASFDFQPKNTTFSNEFVISIPFFTESQKHNPYFNRKLFIGRHGEIKNAPECEEVHGNINDINSVEELISIISTPEFQKYWFVSPDIIDVTKDSEFRYMCVDNRVPHQRKDGSWYYKEEPNYNPYIAKWKGEEGYKTLKECGVICNEQEFSIDHDKIAEINKELWGE